MVKHLSQESQDYLLQIYNKIWTSHQFPDWRKAFFLAFRKPGKSGNEPGHYRPIPLTSCLYKILEKMVNQSILQKLILYLKINYPVIFEKQ